MWNYSYGALTLVVLAGASARAWLLFSPPLVPGINGAYYLVQARALLEKGSLAVPDYPFTFFLHALLAECLRVLAGLPLETAVLWATRLTDTLAPPLAAIPVYALVRGWTVSKGDARPARRWIALAAAAIVATGAPALSMAGDFQKNSLAMLWMACFLHEAWRFLDAPHGPPKIDAGARALGWLTLIGLTHIGVFGSALVMIASIALSHLCVRGKLPASRLAAAPVASVALIALVSGLLVWQFDPVRVVRLLGAFSSPAKFLSSGGNGMPPPPGPGGAPPLDILRFVPCMLAGGIAFAAVSRAWRRRKESPADAAFVTGAALASMALTGPWFPFDMAMRLLLIAILPVIAIWSYALSQTRSRAWRVTGALVPTVVLLGAAIPQLVSGGRGMIGLNEYRELQAIGQSLHLAPGSGGRTLVAAMHGVEWWCAWVLHTHIAQPQALRAQDWTQFDEVLFVELKHPRGFPGSDGPGRRGGRGPSGPPTPGGTPPMPMAGPEIPPTAQILHDGTYFRVARVPQPALPSGPQLP